MKGNIQHDVAQLIDKYGISDVLNAIMELGSDSVVHEMRLWFEKTFMDSHSTGEELDDDVMEAIFHDLQHLNVRLVKVEKAVFSTPTEPVRLPDDVAEKLQLRRDTFDEKISQDIVNQVVEKLREKERTVLPRKSQEK